MPTAFSYTYGDLSAIATFNKWFLDNVGATLPSWMSAVAINFDYPRTPLTFPSFSVTQLGGGATDVASGHVLDRTNGVQYYGVRRTHVVEISCWESRQNPDWPMHLRTMADMVNVVMHKLHSIPFLDAYNAMAATGALLQIGEVQQTTSAPDQNVNVERLRFTATLHWMERWTE